MGRTTPEGTSTGVCGKVTLKGSDGIDNGGRLRPLESSLTTLTIEICCCACGLFRMTLPTISSSKSAKEVAVSALAILFRSSVEDVSAVTKDKVDGIGMTVTLASSLSQISKLPPRPTLVSKNGIGGGLLLVALRMGGG